MLDAYVVMNFLFALIQDNMQFLPGIGALNSFSHRTNRVEDFTFRLLPSWESLATKELSEDLKQKLASRKSSDEERKWKNVLFEKFKSGKVVVKWPRKLVTFAKECRGSAVQSLSSDQTPVTRADPTPGRVPFFFHSVKQELEVSRIVAFFISRSVFHIGAVL